jgi:hypothetical protein
MKQDDGAKSLLLALPEVFPWVRHGAAQRPPLDGDDLGQVEVHG